MTKVCIMLLIGLPGSGKTELCKLLLTKHPFMSKSNSPFQFKHICYDQILSNNVEEGEWRMARDQVQHSTQKHIEWLIQESQGNEGHLVILIDDNMYYQSMRRFYYRLASKQNYSFCQLYVRCDLETALKRVEIRNLQPGAVQVPRNVIQLMATRLEPPDVKSKWQSASLTIDTTQDISSTMSAYLNGDFYAVNGSVGEQAVLTAIQELLEASFVRTEQSASSKALQENPVHQQQPSDEMAQQNLDVVFRRCISSRIQTAKLAGTKPEDLNILAQQLNSIRRTFLRINDKCDFLKGEEISCYIENFISNHIT